MLKRIVSLGIVGLISVGVIGCKQVDNKEVGEINFEPGETAEIENTQKFIQIVQQIREERGLEFTQADADNAVEIAKAACVTLDKGESMDNVAEMVLEHLSDNPYIFNLAITSINTGVLVYCPWNYLKVEEYINKK